MMDATSLVDRLETLTEGDLVTQVVAPLLASLGYRNIESVHGPHESGRDIVCWRVDELGQRRITVVQVKRFRPSARAATKDSFRAVLHQLQQAQEEPVHLKDGTRHQPDELVLVTPYRVTQAVLASVGEQLRSVGRRGVRILDGDQLADLLTRHLPSLVQSLLGLDAPAKPSAESATISAFDKREDLDEPRRKALIDFLAGLQTDLARLIGPQDTIDPLLCFVIMSFSSNPVLADFYAKAVKPTVEGLGYRCERVDEQNFNDRITERVLQNIRAARFVVADLTEARPNCYYELGVAHTLRKEVIHLAYSGDSNAIHFDVKDFNFIVYSRIDELSQRLRERVLATIGQADGGTQP